MGRQVLTSRVLAWSIAAVLGAGMATVARRRVPAAGAPRARTARSRVESPGVAARLRPIFAAVAATSRMDRCPFLSEGDGAGHWIARSDRVTASRYRPMGPWAELVTRSPRFGLAPSDDPSDLVDLATGRSSGPTRCLPPDMQCLRREAAAALAELLSAMRDAGHPGHVHSAFRSFDAQCGVFARWARTHRGGFCEATGGSALPGHSQHQLGTAVDLFTAAWVRGGPPMRAGFGCDPGARWLRANAWRFGWTHPYPEPRGRDVCTVSHAIDPRTGYQYEPWHIRFVGRELAEGIHRAELGGRDDAVADLWVRGRGGFDADADLPVCDGCGCDWCSTYAADRERAPCPGRALRYRADGSLVASSLPPRLLGARAFRSSMGTRVTAWLEVAPDTVTQTPVWVTGLPFDHAESDLPGAWRLAVDSGDGAWRWRFALTSRTPPAWVNGAVRRLPAAGGRIRVEVVVPTQGAVRVALRRDGAVVGGLDLGTAP